MQRRRLLQSLLIGACGSALGGVLPQALTSAYAHTPYKQWQVYRRKHLLIGCHKDVDLTYSLAKSIVSALDTHLPRASARVARAPTAGRIASLMATDQMDVAVVQPTAATMMFDGVGKFKPYGSIALNTLMHIDSFALICRSDLPERHAWLIVDALLEDFPDDGSSDNESVNPERHAGAQLRLSGAPVPNQ